LFGDYEKVFLEDSPRGACLIGGLNVYNRLMEKRNLLITGLPGTGKTTLVTRLIDRFRDLKVVGFYTAEIRTGGERKGFDLVDLRGERVLLSHVGIKGGKRIGKYGVDVVGFERYLGTAPFFGSGTDLVIIDEIGKMECLSGNFTNLVVNLLDAPITVIATIALYGGGIMDRIRTRPDVRLYRVTQDNRDNLADEIEKAARATFARPS